MAVKYGLIVTQENTVANRNSTRTFKKEKHVYKNILNSSSIGKQNVLVLHGSSYDVYPKSFRPNDGRIDVVIDENSQRDYSSESVNVVRSLEQLEVFLTSAPLGKIIDKVFVACDSANLKFWLKSPQVHRIYITRVIDNEYFKPDLELSSFKRVLSEDVPTGTHTELGEQFEFHVYQKQEKCHFDMSIMVAVAKNLAIGYRGGLPWPHLKTDFEMYTHKTQFVKDAGNKVVNVMGRLTHVDLSNLGLTRENVVNVVLTSNPNCIKGSDDLMIVPNLEKTLSICKQMSQVEHLWVMGGSGVYKEALKFPECEKLYITEIDQEFEADAFFPAEYKDLFTITSLGEKIVENNVPYRMNVYTRKSL